MTGIFQLDKRNGKLLGVCAGIGASYGVDTLLVRIAVVLLTLCAAGAPMIAAYLVAGWLANDRAG